MTREQLTEYLAAQVQPGVPFVLVLEGRSAAGKTTLAGMLAERFHGCVVHTDDFFLPRADPARQRRLPGSHMDMERFAREVAEPLQKRIPFAYRAFSCERQAFLPEKRTVDKPFVVVEGAYALLPVLHRYYDLAVFVDISPEKQQRRILLRNGPEGWESFRRRWIPSEEAYIAACSVRERCELILE